MALLTNNTKVCTEDEVRAVPTTEWTRTWHPVSHAQLLDALAHACNETGLSVRDRGYSLNASGTQMFGVWVLDVQMAGLDWTVGFRNSTDKRLSLGICAGTRVLVCDNLAFAGEYVEMQAHTSALTLWGLQEMALIAMEKLILRLSEYSEWQQGLKQIVLPEQTWKSAVFDVMECGALAGKDFRAFLSACVEEQSLAQARGEAVRSLWVLQGGATRILRGESLLSQSRKCGLLETVVKHYEGGRHIGRKQ